MDEVPLLVDYVTMLEIVGEVLVKNVVAHIVVVAVLVELAVPRILVVVVKLVASFVVVTEPCKTLEIVMARVDFLAHVVVVKVLEESLVVHVFVKVLEAFVVPIVVVVTAFVDRQFVAPISFGIPTIVLIALVVWQRELVVVEVALIIYGYAKWILNRLYAWHSRCLHNRWLLLWLEFCKLEGWLRVICLIHRWIR